MVGVLEAFVVFCLILLASYAIASHIDTVQSKLIKEVNEAILQTGG